MREQEPLPLSQAGNSQREGQGGPDGSPSRPLWLLVLVMTLALSVAGLVYLSQAPFLPSAIGTPGGVPTVYVGLVKATPLTPMPVYTDTGPATASPSVVGAPTQPVTVGSTDQGVLYTLRAAGYAALLSPPPHPRAPSAWSYPTASVTPTPTPPPATPASPTNSGAPL